MFTTEDSDGQGQGWLSELKIIDKTSSIYHRHDYYGSKCRIFQKPKLCSPMNIF